MEKLNKKTIISPIAIDLGAVNTGVQFLHDVNFNGVEKSGAIEVAKNTGRTFVIDSKNDIQFLQRDRTTRRHASRGLKRRKMAKRLLLCFLKHHKVDEKQFEKEIDFINGLLNRRGFTYSQEGLDLEFLKDKDVSKVFFALLKDTHLIPKRIPRNAAVFCLENMATFESEKLKTCKQAFDIDIEKYKDLIIEVLAYNEINKDIEREITGFAKELRKNIVNYVEKLIKEQDEGAKHRKTYFKNIQEDFHVFLKKKGLKLAGLLRILGLQKDELLFFISNINNLQLRTLRKYFNQKDNPNVWNEVRLKKYIKNSIIAWHCKEKEDVKRRNTLLHNLNKETLQEYLVKTNPETSIPPYEDQNNRRPNRCASMYLNPYGLDKKFPEWEIVVERLLDKHSFSTQLQDFTAFKEIRVPKVDGKRIDKNKNWKKRQKKAYILQRILDMTKDHDQYQLRNLVRLYAEKNKDADACTEEESFSELKSHLQDKNLCKKYIEFAHYYYTCIDEARRGVWNSPQTKTDFENNIFFCCNYNPPHKNKIAFALVNNLLGTKMDNESLEMFKEEFWRKEKIGRSSFKSFSKNIEERRKKIGNSFGDRFMFSYVDEQRKEKKTNDKELTKLAKTIIDDTQKHDGMDFFQRLEQYLDDKKLSTRKTKIPPKEKWYRIARHYAGRLYILAQLYQILETDIHGFSKSCHYCVKENAWRMQEEEVYDKNVEKRYVAALAVRLSNDSVVPFDGFLGRYLERLAKEITKVKQEQLENSTADEIFIPICIEQNKFDFEETLAKQKQNKPKSKSEMDSRVLDKDERIKSDSKNICPYCGKPIKDGDIDHIIPRSYSLKKYGTIFDSEANLIYVCKKCNRGEKGNALYSFKDLNKSYLKRVFGEKSNNLDALVSTIKDNLSKIFENKRIVNFVVLDEEEKKYVRHGLFIQEVRNEIINKVLNTRIRTIVNGTQAYLAKRINQELIEYGRKANKNIRTYPFQIPAADDNWMSIDRLKKEHKKLVITKELLFNKAGTSTKANRALLAIDYPDYEKPEIQGKQSHIIDATMTFVSVLREAGRLKQILEKTSIGIEDRESLSKEIANTYNDIKAIDLYKNLLPLKEEMKVDFIKRHDKEDGKKIWEMPVFNDTLYGESFYPVYLHSNGNLDFGYRHPNGTKENVQPFKGKNKSSETDFNLLKPYFKRTEIADYQQLLDRLKERKQKYQVFAIEKRKVFAMYEDVFYSRLGHNLFNLDKDLSNSIELLEELRFCTGRVDVLDIMKGKESSKHQYFMYQKSVQDKHRERIENEIKKHFAIEEEKGKRTQQRFESALKFLEENDLFGNTCGKTDKDFWEKWNTWKKKQDDWSSENKFLYTSEKNKNTICTQKEAKERLSKYAKEQVKMLKAREKDFKALKKANFGTADMNKYSFVSAAYVKEYKLKESKREHKKVPTKYSIKQNPSFPDPYFRVRRKDSRKRYIYQLVAIRNCTLGTYSGRKILLQELSKNKNLVPASNKGKNWWIKKWQPYQQGLDIEKLTPHYLETNREEIEKIYFEPKQSKDKSWLTLFFNSENYKKFLIAVNAIKHEEEAKFMIQRKNLITYLDDKMDPGDDSEIELRKELDGGNVKIKFKTNNATLQQIVKSLKPL